MSPQFPRLNAGSGQIVSYCVPSIPPQFQAKLKEGAGTGLYPNQDTRQEGGFRAYLLVVREFMPEVANSDPHPVGNPPSCSRDCLRASSEGSCPGSLERNFPMSSAGCLQRNPGRSGEESLVRSPGRSSGVSRASRAGSCSPVRWGRCPDHCCSDCVHGCLAGCLRRSLGDCFRGFRGILSRSLTV